MSLKIDQKKCIGCGLCANWEPNIFEIDPLIGKAKIKKQPEKISESIKSIVENCPVSAIIIKKNE